MMHGLLVLVLGVGDGVAGTIVFTRGGEWDRTRELKWSAVDVGDLWLVWIMLVDHRACLDVSGQIEKMKDSTDMFQDGTPRERIDLHLYMHSRTVFSPLASLTDIQFHSFSEQIKT
jgi:hypothetical protein